MSLFASYTKDINISSDNYTKLDGDRRNVEVSEYKELSIPEGMSNILQNNIPGSRKLRNYCAAVV